MFAVPRGKPLFQIVDFWIRTLTKLVEELKLR